LPNDCLAIAQRSDYAAKSLEHIATSTTAQHSPLYLVLYQLPQQQHDRHDAHVDVGAVLLSSVLLRAQNDR
jgi:hypothetical protein